ncbi:MAG: PQQ-binding-like beta-propeller repeat protein [Planctomycetota bacterium]
MREGVTIAVYGLRLAAFAAGLASLVMPGARAADWPEFRGPGGRGVAAGERIRTSWSETEGIAWKAELPGKSASSPIVVGDLVVTTASSGARQDRLHVIALDRATGSRRWERTLWATGRTLCHPTSAVAAGTPASDGQRIVALFSSCDLFCLDLAGRLLWQRNLAVEHPRAGNDVGMGSSPRIIGDVVVVQIDCQGEPFAKAIDLQTGDDRWSVARDRVASWASPLACEADGRAAVLLQNPNGLEVRALADGSLAWSWPGDCAGIATTAVTDETLFVPADGIAAVPRGGREPVWRAAKLSPGIASPVAWNGSVAVINRGGVLAVGDAADGGLRGQVRLAGSFWASPIVVGDTLVAINTEGKTFLVSTAERPEIVAENELPGTFTATPAVAGGSLYLRSETALWKVAAPD